MNTAISPVQEFNRVHQATLTITEQEYLSELLDYALDNCTDNGDERVLITLQKKLRNTL